MTKPLFVPLRKIWFEALVSGRKRTEYRQYGPRWNERTCTIGRLAILSCGYSGTRRMAMIIGFTICPSIGTDAADIYPDSMVAAIELELLPQH